MRGSALIAGLVLAVFASSAFAHGGANLHWDGCTADPAHATAKSWACDSNTGPTFDLYASIVMPIPVAQLGAIEFLVDFEWEYRSGSVGPQWWRTGPYECRAGAMTLSYDASVAPLETACDDLWGARPLLATYQRNEWGAFRHRLTGIIAVPAGSEFAVPADGREWNVFMLRYNRTRTTGTGACAGCSWGACIVLNQLRVHAAGGQTFSVNFPAVSNFVTWQAGGPACPQATPAANRTWGAVKNLYR